MSLRKAQAGLTFVELVASIVIVSVATLGLMLAVSATVGRSADPMVQTQAIAIASAYLEEATLAEFCDPSFNPDGNPATTCRNECATRACAGGCGGAVFGAESGRAAFDDVCDYDNLADSGARDRNGTAIANLDNYTVEVRVLDTAGIALGSPVQSASAGKLVRVEVEVSHPALASPVVLAAYKANLQ